jgi:hypothetical protein
MGHQVANSILQFEQVVIERAQPTVTFRTQQTTNNIRFVVVVN